MRRRLSFIVVLWLVAIAADEATAHELALKNGRVIQFEKYRVVDGQLCYSDSSGIEIRVGLRDIDMERTKQLSSADNPPLILPGLESPGARPAPSTTESLGEIARKVRPKSTQSRPQRIFTDDDVVHGTSTTSASVANSADFGNQVQNAQKLIDTWANKTPRELSDGVAGETKFPGREAWEQRLYVQKGKMIGAAQVVLDAAHKIVHASASEERASARRATDKLLADLDGQRTLYDQLVAEGVKRASEWERLHR